MIRSEQIRLRGGPLDGQLREEVGPVGMELWIPSFRQGGWTLTGEGATLPAGEQFHTVYRRLYPDSPVFEYDREVVVVVGWQPGES